MPAPRDRRNKPKKVDTQVDIGDPVLQQLRKLREGRGITPARIAEMGAVMSACATSDPHRANLVIQSALAGLPTRPQTLALKVDFGLSLGSLLEREPTPRELIFLGDRRAGYAEVISRDVKTLARWSDAAISDLRELLLHDTFRGHLYVVAAVDDDHMAGISLIQEDPDQPEGAPTRRTSTDLENPESGASLPCLVYLFPRDWQPRSLTLAAVFRKSMPSEGFAFSSTTLIQLPYARRRPLALQGDTLSFKVSAPSNGLIYGIGWEQSDK